MSKTFAPLRALRASAVNKMITMPDTTDNTPEAIVQTLHALYQERSGFDTLRLTPERMRGWWKYHKAGFTADDLEITLRYLNKEIKAGNRNPGALKWSNLIGLDGANLDHFEEEKVMAEKAGIKTSAQLKAELEARDARLAKEREQATRAAGTAYPQKPLPPKNWKPGQLSQHIAESLGKK